MIEVIRQSLIGQYEAVLRMMHECVRSCPPQHFEGKIANDTFRQIAYHTLFWLDYYLGESEDAFVLRELNLRGGDERSPTLSPGLSQAETLEYALLCRRRIQESISTESEASLSGQAKFRRRKISRLEHHIYNIRHVAHHNGAMCAYLRRVDVGMDMKSLPWVGTGWE